MQPYTRKSLMAYPLSAQIFQPFLKEPSAQPEPRTSPRKGQRGNRAPQHVCSGERAATGARLGAAQQAWQAATSIPPRSCVRPTVIVSDVIYNRGGGVNRASQEIYSSPE